MKPVFSQRSSIGQRLLILGGLALMLIFLSQRLPFFEKLREKSSWLVAPFYWLVDTPSKIVADIRLQFASRNELLAENERLRAEALILEARMQKYVELSAENVRLRELMNSAERLRDTVVVAEVVGVAADPNRHVITVDKGSRQNAFVGQPVIDAQGLVGQLIEVGKLYSRVLMITDASHAVPVRVSRNGLRAVAQGTGLIDELRLAHVAATTDIRVGDILVSSGLGGRFPAGYPVGEVTEVLIDPGKPFAEVRARPLAELDRGRNLLLVFGKSGMLSEGDSSVQPEQAVPGA
ncbi:rod shape-determining protein MreC [Spongiibacter sp. KMU-158]|uniref:Cell shape-determining protein MreC n=1 Tax=Spongiibacter pelagi TaxID=2760804 RepID=A0A927C027_9GAMM|nr:rod shape-determining protein MreC [Spongiibacter pelagi]MBD2858765.1 rod shape-determining protein MreC [Spongiibacter pelagi]